MSFRTYSLTLYFFQLALFFFLRWRLIEVFVSSTVKQSCRFVHVLHYEDVWGVMVKLHTLHRKGVGG